MPGARRRSGLRVLLAARAPRGAPRARRAGGAALLLALAQACASAGAPPPPDALERAARIASYTAELRVSLRGPDLRARTPALLGFRRPDALGVEVPGPSGPRLVAVARAGSLVAVFPGHRAVFVGEATAAGLADLLGVALTPEEVMDLLVGHPPARLREYRAKWGAEVPREIRATLPDGARLTVRVREPETGAPLGDAAFAPPPHEGFRRVDAAQARELWSGA